MTPIINRHATEAAATGHTAALVHTHGLHRAARCAMLAGRLDTLRVLLSQGANVHHRALRDTAALGHTEVISFLLDKFPHLTPTRHTTFMAAVRNSDLDTCRVLVKRGSANVAADSHAALHEAIEQDHHELVDFILLNCPPGTARQHELVMRPAIRNDVAMIQILLEHGANTADAFYELASLDHRYELMPVLLPHIDYSAKRTAGAMSYAFYCAVRNEDVRLCNMLLEHGVPTELIEGGISSLTPVPAARGNKELLELLLAHGANPNGALRLAAQFGQCHILRMLLERGVRDTDGDAMRSAARHGQLNAAQLLANCAPGFNATDALLAAIEYGATTEGTPADNLATIEFLLARGGNATEVLWRHLIWARAPVVAMLLDAGADPNKPSGPMGSGLEVAVSYQHADTVLMLLAQGGDPDANGGEARTRARYIAESVDLETDVALERARQIVAMLDRRVSEEPQLPAVLSIMDRRER
ncbi:hypothetical protein HDU87_001246 [Geranomyces variabilis]|uniref:Ankyrin repeat protein n=1 Tax=Geranomyces variabilis TaxID=109894 RepID=A0AAD5XJ26_9FUNG|nr:hypothetical protein HDU87_001246 [Geranomyces variabilis]